MEKTREQMMDDVCMRWGLEHRRTIEFCEIAEDPKSANWIINYYYNVLMSLDVSDEDE